MHLISDEEDNGTGNSVSNDLKLHSSSTSDGFPKNKGAELKLVPTDRSATKKQNCIAIPNPKSAYDPVLTLMKQNDEELSEWLANLVSHIILELEEDVLMVLRN